MSHRVATALYVQALRFLPRGRPGLRRLYVGNDGGTMTVLRAGRGKELLAEIDMMAPLYSRPAPSGDAPYVATMTHLYFITVKPGSNPTR